MVKGAAFVLAAVWLAAGLATAAPEGAMPKLLKPADEGKKPIVIELRTDDAESLRAFFVRLGYEFLEDFPKEIVDQVDAACGRSQPGGHFVGFVRPPGPAMPWPPPYVCVHPQPFSQEDAEHFCTMAGDHLFRKLVVLENRPDDKTIVCGTAKPEA